MLLLLLLLLQSIDRTGCPLAILCLELLRSSLSRNIVLAVYSSVAGVLWHGGGSYTGLLLDRNISLGLDVARLSLDAILNLLLLSNIRQRQALRDLW